MMYDDDECHIIYFNTLLTATPELVPACLASMKRLVEVKVGKGHYRARHLRFSHNHR